MRIACSTSGLSYAGSRGWPDVLGRRLSEPGGPEREALSGGGAVHGTGAAARRSTEVPDRLAICVLLRSSRSRFSARHGLALRDSNVPYLTVCGSGKAPACGACSFLTGCTGVRFPSPAFFEAYKAGRLVFSALSNAGVLVVPARKGLLHSQLRAGSPFGGYTPQ